MKPTTGTVTFLFADVEGSTSLQNEYPTAATRALAAYTGIVRTVVAARGGYLFNVLGDGTFAAFSDPLEAVRAAVDAQERFHSYDWSKLSRGFPELKVRMGVHTGAANHVDGDYHGLALSRTARVMAAAHGGQILASQATKEAIETVPGSAGIDLESKGEHRLKDLRHTEHLYEIVVPGTPRVARPLATEGVVRRFDAAAGTPMERLRQTLTGANVPIDPNLAEEVRRIPPKDLSEYALTRVAEWAAPRFALDRQFVRLTVLLDRGPDVQIGRWQASPEEYDELRDVLDPYRQTSVVVLGPPGCGKSTLLRRLEFDTSRALVADPNARVPVFVSLSQFGEPEFEPWKWLTNRWSSRYPQLPPLPDILREQKVLFLLDGLNEMTYGTESGRREAVLGWKRFIADVAQSAPESLIVFSCRTLDYSAPLSSPALPVPQVKVEPLSDEQVRDFLKRYAPLNWRGLWTTVWTSGHIDLFRRPYILTLLAGQTHRTPKVPTGMAALFTHFVRGGLRREIERDNPLFEPDSLLALDDVRRVIQNSWRNTYQLPQSGPLFRTIQSLAYEVQRSRPDGEGGLGAIRVEDIQRHVPAELVPVLLRAAADLDLLAQDALEDAVSFRHQLLQGYFAARALRADVVTHLAAVPWRATEVEPPFETLADSLGPSEPIPTAPSSGWDETARLAAEMSHDPEAFVVAVAESNLPLAGRCAAGPEVRARVSETYMADLRNRLHVRSRSPDADPRARVAAAEALGRLGHPALIAKNDALHAPMIKIPGGTYSIGSDEGIYSEEAPVHPVEIEPFRLGAFPVTNAEWARYVAAGGYTEPAWWETEAARAWLRGETTADGARYNVIIRLEEFREAPERLDYFLSEGSLTNEHYQLWQDRLSMSPDELATHLAALFPSYRVTAPRYWDQDQYSNPSQPVVGICWYEARAYCAWLTAQTGQHFRLPTEVEWEAAARGRESRRYAFGNAFDPLLCNTVESHWRKPTPIGVLGGDTPEGITDLTGNVFEWTSSAYARQPYVPVFPYPYDPNDGREEADTTGDILRVMRGGCWAYPEEDSRCSVRLSVHPANRQAVDGLRLCLSEG